MQILEELQLVLARTPEQEWTPLIRGYVTEKLHALVGSLEPYVDGTMGPVSSKHVQNYVAALALLSRVHRVYDSVAPKAEDPDVEDEKRRAAQRAQIHRQLQALDQRARS